MNGWCDVLQKYCELYRGLFQDINDTEKLTSINFRCFPLSYRSGKILDVGVLPVAFTGSKPIIDITF